jgi:VCBS repeat-containing protein
MGLVGAQKLAYGGNKYPGRWRVTRTLRMLLVGLLLSSLLVVVPGEVSATVPGAIGRIAFTSDADDAAGEIYVRDFTGSTPVRLTNNSYTELLPAWSPDGSQIAFTRGWNTNPVTSDLFVMDADGSNAMNLTNGLGSYNLMGDWSPDGFWILFVSNRSGSLALWKMHPDGSSPQMIFNDAGPESGAAWSPDGSRIAFARMSAGTSLDLWVVNADGTGATQLTNSSAPEAQPTWSPDGSRIAYLYSYGSYSDIWAMNADGSNPVNLTSNPGTVFVLTPAWAPDGTKIAFTSDADGDNDIWMMNTDGTGQAHLTDNPADEGYVSWEQVNRLPNAVNDSVDVWRGGSVVVSPLSNDSDPDGEDLEISDVTRMPTEGSVVINADGTITYTHDGSNSAGYPYTDSFEYEVQDVRLGSARADVTVWIHAFDDVPVSNIFNGDIAWLASQGITNGCNPPDNTLFCPDDPVTRGQMAAFLVRARGYTNSGAGNLFVDDNGSVFEADIDRLGTAGVTRGCNPPVNDMFCPDEMVTRGQMAAFLSRAFNLSAGGMSNLFADDDGSVFEVDIDKLGATGVSKGCNPPVNDMFCPNEPVTREQMAAFIHRALQVAVF